MMTVFNNGFAKLLHIKQKLSHAALNGIWHTLSKDWHCVHYWLWVCYSKDWHCCVLLTLSLFLRGLTLLCVIDFECVCECNTVNSEESQPKHHCGASYIFAGWLPTQWMMRGCSPLPCSPGSHQWWCKVTSIRWPWIPCPRCHCMTHLTSMPKGIQACLCYLGTGAQPRRGLVSPSTCSCFPAVAA